MLRFLVAVAAGFLIMSVLLLATQVALLQFLVHRTPDGVDLGERPPLYLLVNAICVLFFAVVGGCITGAIGKKYEAPTILGALMLGMAIGSVVMHRDNVPLWYAILVPLAGAFTATIAGYTWIGRPQSEVRSRK